MGKQEMGRDGDMVLMGDPAGWSGEGGLCWGVSQGPSRQVGRGFLLTDDLPDPEDNAGCLL